MRSGAVQAALVSCTSASAVSITALTDQAGASWSAWAWLRTSAATWARPPRTSARSWASHLSSRSATVSPWWDLACRVAKVALRCSRSSSSEFGARPNWASNAATKVLVLAVIARRREENRSMTFWSMPTTSRALPSGRVASRTPSARVRCSSITRSPTAEAAPR